MNRASAEKDHGEGERSEGMIKDIFDRYGNVIRTEWDGTEWKDKSVEEETDAYLTAYRKKYPNLKEWEYPKYLPTYGELFFIRYAHIFATGSKVDIRKLVSNIEGQDAICFDLLGRNGNIEIKTIENFLTRNDTPKKSPDTGGTIPFEIFHSWPRSDNKLKLEDLYAGWLLSAYHNIIFNWIKDEHGRDERANTPGLYAFVLTGSNEKPYAVVVFEDIQALLTRLYEICPDAEHWGIPDPDTLIKATDRTYWDKFDARYHYDNVKGGMIHNVWHVPFRTIQRLATVTMIGDVDPQKELDKAKYKCNPEIAEKRYKNLQWKAEQCGNTEHFDPKAYTEDENRRIKNLEAQGAKVKKRNVVDMNVLEQLKKKDEQ